MRYKYLLFDLDGTLVNTTEGVLKSAQAALKHFGIYVDLNELMPFFGPPLKVSFTTLYGLSETEADEAVRIYLKRYEQFGLKESFVFPEIPEILKQLHNAGYILGVATSKYEEHAKDTLRHHNILNFFHYVTGANIDETISKKHEVIDEALNRFNAQQNKSSVLMIGDMKYDVIGAKTIGIDCLGIYTGTSRERELEAAGATYIAYSFDELRKFLIEELI